MSANKLKSHESDSPRVSSPLSSPSTTPRNKSVALPDSNLTPLSAPSFFRRQRGRSTSAIDEVPDKSSLQSPSSVSISIATLSRVTSSPIPAPPLIQASSSSSTVGPAPSASASSTFSFRGRSKYRDLSPGPLSFKDRSPTPPGALSRSWWGRQEEPRPWRDPPKRKNTIPKEQTEGWVHTRSRVAKAAASVLGTAGDVAHEALLISVDVLQFAPIVGLEEAARVLLNIWDSLQLVDMNRLACLRLTERCADILLSVREEVADAGDEVGQELHAPIVKLVDSFTQVHAFLQKQIGRPFLKRYLKRDEILRQIAACDAALGDSLGMFSLSIQIRILKQVQKAEAQRQADTRVLLDSLHLPTDHASTSGQEILSLLRAVHDEQNAADLERDISDLRQLMRGALQTSNDAEIIGVLQVGREEIAEAMKTLQRALEREVEREGEVADAGVVDMRAGVGGFVIPAPSGEPIEAPTPGPEMAADAGTVWVRDTLDREFLEGGIDALQRISKNADMSLPSWTITRYEVDREEKIGMGFFSDVYRGRWRQRVVAIKQLAPTTPRKLFVHEIAIWETLKHPNVLELLGASSASGDPPWFLVSPYCANGSLVTYLKDVKNVEEVDLLRAMHEVAKGMSYLHGRGVLHGDLKAANILVDDDLHCLVSDFGQSEMKSEVYRLSGTPQPHGTFRWLAPELLQGHNQLTPEVDVYAYAMCFVEALTRGAIPWHPLDDSTVYRLVAEENKRPILPLTHVSSPALTNLLNLCWDRDPHKRPPFEEIQRDMKLLRIRSGTYREDSPHPPLIVEGPFSRPSPDMRPVQLPDVPQTAGRQSTSYGESYKTATDEVAPPHVHVDAGPVQMPRPKPYTPSTRSSISTLFGSTSEGHSEGPRTFTHDGCESPPPVNEKIAERRNERRYRMLLSHEFHPSLTLPLWTPSPIALGSVGYLSKPKGEFVTLFNALDPSRTSNGFVKGMPSMHGFGRITTGKQFQDKRTAMQKGMDAIHGLFRGGAPSQTVGRRYSFGLRAGHKAAYMCTETMTYNYIVNLEPPKKWFKSNIDTIMKLFGPLHQIKKEDLYLAIGTLDAPDYALFVSHKHPDGQGHFDVYSSPRSGQDWGKFSVDEELGSDLDDGPAYHEHMPGVTDTEFASKVSTVGAQKADTLLVARLRFKPDILEPTSL